MSEKQPKDRQLLENDAAGTNDRPCAGPDTGHGQGATNHSGMHTCHSTSAPVLQSDFQHMIKIIDRN